MRGLFLLRPNGPLDGDGEIRNLTIDTARPSAREDGWFLELGNGGNNNA